MAAGSWYEAPSFGLVIDALIISKLSKRAMLYDEALWEVTPNPTSDSGPHSKLSESTCVHRIESVEMYALTFCSSRTSLSHCKMLPGGPPVTEADPSASSRLSKLEFEELPFAIIA